MSSLIEICLEPRVLALHLGRNTTRLQVTIA